MEQKKNGKATASLVLGIISSCTLLFPGSKLASFVCGILGLIFGAQAKRETNSGKAKAGFILSLISLCCFGALLLAVVALVFVILGVIVTAL